MTGKLQNQFRSDKPAKEYIALVDGKFPDTSATDGLLFDHPIESFKINSTKTKRHSEAKECKTVFHKLSTYQVTTADGVSYCSLVRCIPIQGRTHQIRIHLMLMGHPIVHDYLYNNRDVKCRPTPNLDVIDSALNSMIDKYNVGNQQHSCNNSNRSSEPHATNDLSHHLNWSRNLTKQVGSNVSFCLECELGCDIQQCYDEDHTMFMCLHSWKYRLDSINKSFEAKWPKWANDMRYVQQMLEFREERVKKYLTNN